MQPFGLICRWFFSILCLLPLLFFASNLTSAIVPNPGNETDRLALLDFKKWITQDPLTIMDSWNGSTHHCKWNGVTCSSSNGRVMALRLMSQDLAGSLPPSIGNLTYLTGIDLNSNRFNGEIPQQIGNLLHLQYYNVSHNFFSGNIPINLTHCKELNILDMGFNKLVGQIPDQLSSLSKLSYFRLRNNNLTGDIPAWIGNFSLLRTLSFEQNALQGSIPPELGHLTRLEMFHVYDNELTGTIPSSIYNISSIVHFSVVQNKLHGQLPPDVGLTLPNLRIYAGGVNYFTGPIPSSLSNASSLRVIDFAQNSLTGAVPQDLGHLQYLYRLNFDDNKLGNREAGDLNFVASLANCTNLHVLGLADNLFAGEFPASIANLSASLEILTLGSNSIHGILPASIANLISLTLLGLEENNLSGIIPDSIGKLQNLVGLYISGNKFSRIPSSFGNLTSLTDLYMERNRLEESIPPELGNCTNLKVLNLSDNNLIGAIPKEVIGLSSLSISLNLARNSLNGSLPDEVGQLVNLEELDVSDNNLKGQIPGTLSSCRSLRRLILDGNFFQGKIPESLKEATALDVIGISRNNLSGEIPEFLGKLASLRRLNLSFNKFQGEVPNEGIFSNASAVSLAGNNNLCGGALDLHLHGCSRKQARSSGKLLNLRIVIPVSVSILFVVLLLCFFAAYYKFRQSRERVSVGFHSIGFQLRVSYQEIFRSTNGFSMDNLIGSGSFGSVYKGVLHDHGKTVAVKVLNLQDKRSSKSFIDECRALKIIRHRNLLKIVTACSSIDHQGNDFKCLVFEFMTNGNLDQWLHQGSNEQGRNLNILQRLNIAIDVASALDYLHNQCQTPVAHCDLKPSNILLDEHMTAHVGDFGLAKILLEESVSSSLSHSLSVELKGSIGYTPPEYGSGAQVSTLGDVYSYGILVLELFTGKRPTDDIFENGLNIRDFVAMALPERILEVIDPSWGLFEEGIVLENDRRDEILEERGLTNRDDWQRNSNSRMKECLKSAMKIAVSCTTSTPSDRMPITTALKRLNATRRTFQA